MANAALDVLGHAQSSPWFKRSPRWLGLGRLLRIVVGWKAESSQEMATHSLMIIGFGIEAYLLYHVVWTQFTADVLDRRGASTARGLEPFVGVVLVAVIVLLLFHQFVIFRNFTLHREALAHAQANRLDAVISKLPVGSIVTSESLDSLRAILPTQGPVQTDSWRRTRKAVEIMTALCFGILTGEAGYMLTVLHERDAGNWSARLARGAFGTTSLGETLECSFLFGAVIICVLVLLWDSVVQASPVAKQAYGAFLHTFWWNDVWSFLFWSCLFIVVTPTARFHLGAREVGQDLGYCMLAWLILSVFSGFYISVIGKRCLTGLQRLGEAESYRAARVILI